MSEKRMFSKTIIDSDAFLDMALSTQALYFHLSMRADDEGFINNPKKIMRMIGSAQNEMELLLAKKFIIFFESGVIVIKHWKIHNYIRKDRIKETLYQKEKYDLKLKNNGSYSLVAKCPPVDRQVSAQVRLDKVRLDKVRLDKVYSQIFEKWNSCNIIVHQKITDKIKTNINTLLKDFNIEDILKAIDNYSNIYHSENTFFNHKWTLEEFLKRDNGMRVFLYKNIDDYSNEIFSSTNKKEVKQFECFNKDKKETDNDIKF